VKGDDAMMRSFLLAILGLATVALPHLRACSAMDLEYEIHHGIMQVGRQAVSIEKAPGQANRWRVTEQTRVKAGIWPLEYRYDEDLTAVGDGPVVVEYEYRLDDNGRRSRVVGRPEKGSLQVTVSEDARTRTLRITKDQYSLHSWTMYIDAALFFLNAPPGPRRVFDLEGGTISQETVRNEGQETVRVAGRDFVTTRVSWKRGPFVSNSWHAAELSNVPVKYSYMGEHGETLFLLKWGGSEPK
jgi:hypothetical protein